MTFREPDGTASAGFIDLYKKGCFVLEAKQSRQKDGKKTVPGQGSLFPPEEDNTNLGRRTANRNWDTLMLNARQQAADYAKALEPSEGWPPFLIVCDVGNCFEVFADFTGQGKNYQQFPDRNGFRIYLEELRDPDIAKRLAAIWTDPRSLDPSAHSAKVTRAIAGRLAEVSKGLEARGHDAEDVALFLMRCLFTMFAEDVKLLPDGCFKRWLKAATTNKARFKHELADLWKAMDKGGYATIAETEREALQRRLLPQRLGAGPGARGDRRAAGGGRVQLDGGGPRHLRHAPGAGAERDERARSAPTTRRAPTSSASWW